MVENTELMTVDNICNRVYVIRGQQVMLDYDLAEIYGYEVKRLNEQVKRNITRFPEDFMFQLTKDFTKSKYVCRTGWWKKKGTVCIHGARDLYACYSSKRKPCGTTKHFYNAFVS